MKMQLVEVKKVRNKNSIKPIKLNKIQANLLIQWFGGSLQEALNKYISMIAKQRKWSWYEQA